MHKYEFQIKILKYFIGYPNLKSETKSQIKIQNYLFRKNSPKKIVLGSKIKKSDIKQKVDRFWVQNRVSISQKYILFLLPIINRI